MYFLIPYIFILSCFLLCLIRNYPLLRIPRVRFLPCALFLTACADYFLIFTDSFLTGVLLFCLVQLCYRLFLGGAWKPFLKCSLLALPFLILLGSFSEALLVPSLFYIGCLFGNIRLSRSRKNFRLLFAFTLMLLCDVHVGIANLPRYLVLQPSFFYLFASRIFWIFYLPSQLFICCCPSGCPENLQKASDSPSLYSTF